MRPTDTRFECFTEEELQEGFFFLIGYLGRDHAGLQAVFEHLLKNYPKDVVMK